MRRYLLVAAWALGFLCASSVYAGASAMVLNVAGDVVVENFGKTSKVQPFSRLLEGDRVKLPAGGKLTLVYVGSGRQEAWSGAGAIVAGEEQSTPVAGPPSLEAKQLPKAVAQQMARTPLADSTGKTGMVRVRAIGAPDGLDSLEQKYQELRRQSAPGDRTPEVFLLAGLLERGAYDRLEQEVARIQKDYPGDESAQTLTRIYTKALSDVRQLAQH